MLITDIKVLKPALLTSLFQANGVLHEQEVVAQIRQLGQGESNASLYYHLSVQYKDFRTQRHAPDKIFVKLTKPNQPQEFIRREVDFYNQIVPAMTRKNKLEDLCLVRCYDAYFDEISGQSHLILENIADDFKPSSDKHPPSQRHREQIFDALARFHAHWWEHPILENLADMPSAEKIDANIEVTKERYAAMLKYSGAQYISERHKEMLEKISSAMPSRRKERLVNGDGVTLVHRDLHPGNLMYSMRESRIVDWQSWRIDTATDDLAYMITCFFPQHFRDFQEAKLLRRYYDNLVRFGVDNYKWSDFEYDYRASIARCVSFLLYSWSVEKHMRGYWQRAELALDSLDKINGMEIFD